MGLVKTRRLAALRKQTTFAKATKFRQRAKAGLNQPVKQSVKPGWRGGATNPERFGAVDISS